MPLYPLINMSQKTFFISLDWPVLRNNVDLYVAISLE